MLRKKVFYFKINTFWFLFILTNKIPNLSIFKFRMIKIMFYVRWFLLLKICRDAFFESANEWSICLEYLNYRQSLCGGCRWLRGKAPALIHPEVPRSIPGSRTDILLASAAAVLWTARVKKAIILKVCGREELTAITSRYSIS